MSCMALACVAGGIVCAKSKLERDSRENERRSSERNGEEACAADGGSAAKTLPSRADNQLRRLESSYFSQSMCCLLDRKTERAKVRYSLLVISTNSRRYIYILK